MYQNRFYTHAERLEILKYIIQEKAYDNLRGVSCWQQLERKNVIPRSWQSAKEHFRKYIVHNLAKFEIPADEMHKILAGYNRTSQSAFTVAKLDSISGSTSKAKPCFKNEESDSTRTSKIFAEDAQKIKLKNKNELPLAHDFENEKNKNNISTEDDKNNKRKRASSSSSSSSVEIVAVFKQDDLDVQTKQFKKIKHMDSNNSEPSTSKIDEDLKSTKYNMLREWIDTTVAVFEQGNLDVQTKQFKKFEYMDENNSEPSTSKMGADLKSGKPNMLRKWIDRKGETKESSPNSDGPKILNAKLAEPKDIENNQVLKEITNQNKENPPNLEEIGNCQEKLLESKSLGNNVKVNWISRKNKSSLKPIENCDENLPSLKSSKLPEANENKTNTAKTVKTKENSPNSDEPKLAEPKRIENNEVLKEITNQSNENPPDSEKIGNCQEKLLDSKSLGNNVKVNWISRKNKSLKPIENCDENLPSLKSSKLPEANENQTNAAKKGETKESSPNLDGPKILNAKLAEPKHVENNEVLKEISNQSKENPPNLEEIENCQGKLLESKSLENNVKANWISRKNKSSSKPIENCDENMPILEEDNENKTNTPKKVKVNRKEKQLRINAQKLGVDENLVVNELKRFKAKKRKQKLQMKKLQTQGDATNKLDDKDKVIEYLNKKKAQSNCEKLYLNKQISTKVCQAKYFKALGFIEKFYDIVSSDYDSTEMIQSDPLLNEIHNFLKKDEEISLKIPDRKEKVINSVKPKVVQKGSKGRAMRRRLNIKKKANEIKKDNDLIEEVIAEDNHLSDAC